MSVTHLAAGTGTRDRGSLIFRINATAFATVNHD